MQNLNHVKQRLAARIHSELLPATIAINVGNVPFTVNVLTEESLAIELGELEATASDLNTLQGDARKRWSDALAEKLSYLNEPLSVIEHDDEAKVVQIRSSSPSVVDKKSEFYELLVKDRSLELCRVAFDRATKIRKRIPMVLTKEIAARMICDIADAIGTLSEKPLKAKLLRRS